MSFKILFPLLGITALMYTSCAPLTPYGPAPSRSLEPVLTPDQQAAKAAEQKRLEDEARAEARRKAQEREASEEVGFSPGGGIHGGPDPDIEPPKSDYRWAIPIPGKEGFVFNPFTNNPVDVRGIPSGTLVRDPQDPNKAHKFRVP